MKIERFGDSTWQKAKELTVFIYSPFRGCKDFAFCDQICRAAVSIKNNIAEGFERQTNKELKKFLYSAKGSSCEVRSMLYPADALKYISPHNY